MTLTQMKMPTKAERDENLTSKYFPNRWHPRFHPVFFYADEFSEDGDYGYTMHNQLNTADATVPTTIPASPNTFAVIGTYDDSGITEETDDGIFLDNVFLGVSSPGATEPDWLAMAHERLNEQFAAELQRNRS